MPKIHAYGARAIEEIRSTACNAYLADGPRAVTCTENLALVDCKKCMSVLGIGENDEKLALIDHRYRDPRTGEILPFSVTGIARAFDDGDAFGAGAQWGARLQREGKSPTEERDKAGDLGSRIHEHAPRWLAGLTLNNVLPDEERRLDALAAFIKAKQPETLFTERAIILRACGGRFDWICCFDGKWWLIDFKTGRENETKDKLQLAPYWFADGMVVFDANGNAIGLEEMPWIEGAGCLYLREDGTSQWRPWLTTREEGLRWFGHFNSLLQIKLDIRTTTAKRKANK